MSNALLSLSINLEVTAIHEIDIQRKSNRSFNREVYSRILAVAFGAIVSLNMTLEGFLAVGLIPFAATKMAFPQLIPTDHMSFKAVSSHFKQLARYTNALILTPGVIINPKATSAIYNIILQCHLDPRAVSFNSLLKYAWTHQSVILKTSAFLIATVALQWSGIFTRPPFIPKEDPRLKSNGFRSDV